MTAPATIPADGVLLHQTPNIVFKSPIFFDGTVTLKTHRGRFFLVAGFCYREIDAFVFPSAGSAHQFGQLLNDRAISASEWMPVARTPSHRRASG